MRTASYLHAPEVAPDAARDSAFDALLDATAPGAPLAYGLPHPKHELLVYLAESRGFLLHGTNEDTVEIFEPRTNTDYLGRERAAVFAASDGIWPMFFACVNRRGFRGSMWNACVRLTGGKVYQFSLSREAIERTDAWCDGTVYVFERDGFSPVLDPAGRPLEEWASERAVRPRARLRVSPGDFPFLADVRTHETVDAARFNELLGWIAGCVEAIEDRPDGFALRFPPGADTVEALCELAGLMWRYQPFGLELDFLPDRGPVWARLRGRDPAKEILAHEPACSARNRHQRPTTEAGVAVPLVQYFSRGEVIWMGRPRTRRLVLVVAAATVLAALMVPRGAQADQPSCGGEWSFRSECLFDNIVRTRIDFGGVADGLVAVIIVRVVGESSGTVYGQCFMVFIGTAACGDIIKGQVPESPLICRVDGIFGGVFGCVAS